LPAWTVVCEVLGLFHRAVENVGADRHWAQHWCLVRPDLAAYRYTDAELEAMTAAIRADLKGPSPDLSVPALLGPSTPAPVPSRPGEPAPSPQTGKNPPSEEQVLTFL